MELKSVFGDVIRKLREKNSMTQIDLTEKSGYHKNYISLLETAQRQPSLETIFAIAKAFTYGITAFGTIYLFKFFNHVGLLILLVPVNIGYFFALNFFKKLEIQDSSYDYFLYKKIPASGTY